MSVRNIIIIGFVIAVLELIIGVVYLKQSGRKASLEPIKQVVQNQSGETTEIQDSASLSLSSDKTTLKVGEAVKVSVKLKINGKSSTASDLTIKYDPKFLYPVSKTNPFEKGDLYERIVFNAADFKTGLATMSAISSADKQASGEGVLAVIQFRALKEGQTGVKVVFSLDNTTDSNVVVDARDVLTNASDLSLQITP